MSLLNQVETGLMKVISKDQKVTEANVVRLVQKVIKAKMAHQLELQQLTRIQLEIKSFALQTAKQ